jgi:hypothetical protein
VTVGNEEKKQFLINEYNIPEDHIFSSRDIHFADKIMTMSIGKGVNSLAGERSETSFRSVSDNGMLVEIGKYYLQININLGYNRKFLRNISFNGITPEQVFIETQKLLKITSNSFTKTVTTDALN